ncbi:MAG: very short patch repair endonuclease [Microlunatus sp.]|nr:very short patch repair endonuclease [Microlunatus sp.]MDN5771400.1 very short patch repair endonuclease [Microlunatus sp.]
MTESWASSPAVRSVMRGNRGRDTRPEMRVRSLVHAAGLRYRVSVRPLADRRSTADLVFTRAKVAVFIDGCYWHGCPEHLRPARTNAAFWQDKIEVTQARDTRTDAALRDAGWASLRFWEHEDPRDVAGEVVEVVRRRSSRYAPGGFTASE